MTKLVFYCQHILALASFIISVLFYFLVSPFVNGTEKPDKYYNSENAIADNIFHVPYIGAVVSFITATKDYSDRK